MLVSETHFTNEKILRICDYNIYSIQDPSNKARGGASVLIRHSVNHFEANTFFLRLYASCNCNS